MKIACNHCGAQNELGRMFCMACGKRMTITRQDVSQATQAQRSFHVFSVIRPLLILTLLALALAALRPQAPFESTLSEQERMLAYARVATRVNGLLAAARARRAVKASFTSEDLAVYLKNRPAGPAGQDTLSVRLDGARMSVRQQAFLGPYTLGGKRLGPFPFTRELTVVPKGRIFEPRAGRFGRLPLPGPLARLVSGSVARAFPLNAAEQAIEKQIAQLTIQDGKLEIVLGP